MTIKITGLELTKKEYEATALSLKDTLINGTLKLELNNNGIKATTDYKLSNVSNKLHKKLIAVLHEIEVELNGANISEDTKVKLHSGESVIPKVDAEEMLKISESLPELLKDAEKVFNLVINAPNMKSKSASELVDEIAKIMKEKGKWS